MYMFGFFHKKTFGPLFIALALGVGPVHNALAQISAPQTQENPAPLVEPNPDGPPAQEDIPSILQAPDPNDIVPPKSRPDISDLLRENQILKDKTRQLKDEEEKQGGDLPFEDGDASLEVELSKKSEETEDEEASEQPDYSQLTEAERTVRLDLLFERLGVEEDAESASLIAEDIWAIWLESGSATVNYILRRGTAAQKRGDVDLARRMFDHVTTLSPDYAEGWSRSARLALEEKDFNRAFVDVGQALLHEPRHFYALWTLGNVCEQLGLQMQALEAYKEAHRLYPELAAVKDRLGLIEQRVDGDLL